jgi:hypothetical protein
MTDQVEQESVDLVENESEVSEGKGHNPETAPADALASTDAAAKVVKQSPMPKTKAAMVAGITQKVMGMSKLDAGKLYGSMYGTEQKENVEAEEEAIVEADNTADIKIDFSEDMKALVESEATLSDEFKEKTAVIFEMAVKSKLSEEISRLEENYKSELNEEINSTKEELVEKVDGYLNYVVENWMAENKVAVENGLRTEIAENFMGKMKDLFVESYIDVPDSKVDLVDDLNEQVVELEDQLNTSTGKMIAMAEELELFQRYEVVREHANGLAETEVEKLASLVEDLDFDDVESFSAKVKIIKENHFKKAIVETQVEEIEEGGPSVDAEATSSMDQYLTALKKSIK